jgi:hypothetical protein
LDLAFRLEPIVQGAPWLVATFNIDFVGAASNLLFRRDVPD